MGLLQAKYVYMCAFRQYLKSRRLDLNINKI
jgi:hypothetical protein